MSDPASAPRPSATIALALAAFAVGVAIHIRNGLFHPHGMLWLTAALVMAAIAMFPPRLRWLKGQHERWPVLVLSFILIVQLILHLISPPAEAFEPDVRGWRLPIFALCILGTGVWLALHLMDVKWLRTHRMTALLMLHFLAGGWILTQTPEPFIDVYIFQRDAAAALLDGRNPYTLIFPNIYGPDAFVYAPQVMADDRLLFGYPYMPLALLLALPGHLFFGDFRWAHLAAAAVAGLFIGNIRPGPVAPLAAAVFLFTPRMFHVLEMGWTEPQAAMLLAATAYAMVRRPGTSPIALGLLLAVKQYLVILVPLTLLLAGRPIEWRRWLRLTIGAGFIALIVTLPLALWDIGAFIHSAATLQLHQPFRLDALSFPAWLAISGGPQLPIWITLAAALVVIVIALRRLPHGAFGFATAAGTVLLVFFAFNKQAFANYYLLVIAGLCCAVAATDNRNLDTPTPNGDLI